MDDDWKELRRRLVDEGYLFFRQLQDPERMRISLDNRYQAIGDPIAEHMLLPHLSNFHPLSWEEVYRHWESDDLQYYWHRHQNPVVPRDLRYSEQGFAEALERARSGDDDALLHLRRLVKRDPTTPQARTAQAVLKAS